VNTRYEILESLPTYGPMYIPVTGDDEPYYSQGFAVRFYRDDKSDWAANFKPGWTGLNGIYELDNPQKLLVIAGGTCYVMNPNDTKPFSVFGVGYENVIKTNDGRLVLHDLTDITVIESNGDHWDSDRISWDGLKDLRLEGNLVTGLSYDPMNDADEWIEFNYNIDTKEMTGGIIKRYDKKGKTWWQIWK
jgi:hypothetical protein